MALESVATVGHHAVRIGGHHEGGDRRAHGLGHQARVEVAEVAAGHGHHQGRVAACLGRGLEVVERLGQQPRDVDAVGRGQAQARNQLRILEGPLHQPLAVVEDAIHREGEHVAAAGGELAFLQGRHAARGVEHHHLHTGEPMEGAGHGGPGVARGGRQHGARMVSRTEGQDPGQEAGAEILEGQGGTVEEFQRGDPIIDLHQRRRKGES
jgi:hypothetical protein